MPIKSEIAAVLATQIIQDALEQKGKELGLKGHKLDNTQSENLLNSLTLAITRMLEDLETEQLPWGLSFVIRDTIKKHLYYNWSFFGSLGADLYFNMGGIPNLLQLINEMQAVKINKYLDEGSLYIPKASSCDKCNNKNSGLLGYPLGMTPMHFVYAKPDPNDAHATDAALTIGFESKLRP